MVSQTTSDKYRGRAFLRHGVECQLCGLAPDSRSDLVVHHVDGDRENNDPENLMPLCQRCHMQVHKKSGGDYPEVAAKIKPISERSMPTRTINVTFENDDFEQLEERKGSRSWREAILEEFGVQQ